MSWYNTGEEAERHLDDEQERQARRQNQIRRFYLPAGESSFITFVDDIVHPGGFKLPFVYWEHQLNLGGHWRNWFTCLGRITDQHGNRIKCPLCQSGDIPYLAAAYTVIDHNEWEDRQKVKHKDEIRLFIAKSKVLKILRKITAKKKSLRGWYTEVTRTDKYSPNTGDQFDFEEKTDLQDKIQPVDYIEVLKPLSIEELNDVIGGVTEEEEDTIRF